MGLSIERTASRALPSWALATDARPAWRRCAGQGILALTLALIIVTILSFVWGPGRTLDDLDDTREWATGTTLNTARDESFLVIDGLIRGIVAAIAVIDQTKDEFNENMLSDVIVGWDAPGLDIDSTTRPAAADLLASRMVSFSLRHDGDPADEELKLSWLYLPRRLGTPARPHQLFLALGGALSIDQVLNPNREKGDPAWRFRVGVKSDAGAAVLLSGDGIEASPEASGLQASFGYVATPDESGVSYALPRSTGIRVELGGISFLLTLSATGARVLLELDNCALVVDGSNADSFIRKLLGGKPYRTMFGLSLGYDSNLGFIHEVHRVSGVDATTNAAVPFDSSGPAGPSDLDITLPLGGGNVLGINVLELVLRLAWRSADEPQTGWAVAAGGLVTFSATWGPVYLRVDELGLLAQLDTISRPTSGICGWSTRTWTPACPPASRSTCRPARSAAAARSITTWPAATTTARWCCGSATGSP